MIFVCDFCVISREVFEKISDLPLASIVVQQSQNEVSFQRKGSSVISKFSVNLYSVNQNFGTGLAVLSIHKNALSTFSKLE